MSSLPLHLAQGSAGAQALQRLALDPAPASPPPGPISAFTAAAFGPASISVPDAGLAAAVVESARPLRPPPPTLPAPAAVLRRLHSLLPTVSPVVSAVSAAVATASDAIASVEAYCARFAPSTAVATVAAAAVSASASADDDALIDRAISACSLLTSATLDQLSVLAALDADADTATAPAPALVSARASESSVARLLFSVLRQRTPRQKQSAAQQLLLLRALLLAGAVLSTAAATAKAAAVSANENDLTAAAVTESTPHQSDVAALQQAMVAAVTAVLSSPFSSNNNNNSSTSLVVDSISNSDTGSRSDAASAVLSALLPPASRGAWWARDSGSADVNCRQLDAVAAQSADASACGNSISSNAVTVSCMPALPLTGHYLRGGHSNTSAVATSSNGNGDREGSSASGGVNNEFLSGVLYAWCDDESAAANTVTATNPALSPASAVATDGPNATGFPVVISATVPVAALAVAAAASTSAAASASASASGSAAAATGTAAVPSAATEAAAARSLSAAFAASAAARCPTLPPVCAAKSSSLTVLFAAAVAVESACAGAGAHLLTLLHHTLAMQNDDDASTGAGLQAYVQYLQSSMFSAIAHVVSSGARENASVSAGVLPALLWQSGLPAVAAAAALSPAAAAKMTVAPMTTDSAAAGAGTASVCYRAGAYSGCCGSDCGCVDVVGTAVSSSAATDASSVLTASGAIHCALNAVDALVTARSRWPLVLSLCSHNNEISGQSTASLLSVIMSKASSLLRSLRSVHVLIRLSRRERRCGGGRLGRREHAPAASAHSAAGARQHRSARCGLRALTAHA